VPAFWVGQGDCSVVSLGVFLFFLIFFSSGCGGRRISGIYFVFFLILLLERTIEGIGGSRRGNYYIFLPNLGCSCIAVSRWLYFVDERV
jgi:hypothetical protein